MVGGDEIDCAVSESGPELLAIFALADGGRAFEFSGGVGNFPGGKGEVMRACFDRDSRAALLCLLYQSDRV